MRRRLSPHPFLDFASLPPDVRLAWRRGNVRKVLAHLTDDEGTVRPAGPMATADRNARGSMLALARRLGREAAGEPRREERPQWRMAGPQDRREGLVSVVMLAGDVRRTARAVDSLMERAAEGEGEVELVVVDRGSDPHVALGLHARLHGRSGVDLVRHARSVTATNAVNLAVARSSGEILLLLAPHVVLRRGALAEVLKTLRGTVAAGVQPLLLAPDDTIASAGLAVVAPGQPPQPLLRGHQKEDARRLRGEPLPAISGDAMVLRAEDVVGLGGLQAGVSWERATLDLCARLLQRYPGGFRLAATALATTPEGREADPPPPHPGLPVSSDILERIGFHTQAPSREGDDPAPMVTARRRSTPDELRWSLKLPSWAGRAGDLWGDTHFADALAEALRDLGQDVVTARRGAHRSGPTHLDDVSLALRGLYPVPPVPGQLNVLWVISHPDDVDPWELDGYDIVCAASTTWSAELSARTGRAVVPLLQASGFEPPSGDLLDPPRTSDAVFVGSTEGRVRPLVHTALAAGIPLAVYGRGWSDLPGGVWCGEYVDNRVLPELYARHGIVLADHWPDMARHGFIANRVFDAVASGARVICDDVVGVEEVFDPRDVRVARTPEEVSEAYAALSRVEAGEKVPRPSLSFRDRARDLLSLVSDR